MWIIWAFILAAACPDRCWGCQLPRDWRPQTEACRAELAEIIVFAKVLALHKESYNVYNDLPSDTELLFSAEIELLCDQAWGSMLEVPAGSRFNVTGMGYFTCFSYSVTKNNNYYFFLRMDENYNIMPHGVNFQDPIFPDTADNHRMFASLFQFANCTSGTHVHSYAPEWEAQEDSRLGLDDIRVDTILLGTEGVPHGSILELSKTGDLEFERRREALTKALCNKVALWEM